MAVVGAPPRSGARRTRWIFGLLGLVLLGLAAMYALNPFGTATLDPRARIFGYVPYRVPSTSMEPGVMRGDFVLASAMAYRSADPARGDVIVFHPPHQPDQTWMKRVVAVGGDTLDIRAGVVHVNGSPLSEPWHTPSALSMPQSVRFGPVTVPPQAFFVLGDNRDNSEDSRFWGPVARSAVIGRVTRIWMSDDATRVGPLR